MPSDTTAPGYPTLPVEPIPVEASAPISKKAVSASSGKASFYGGNLGGGMCSFTGYTIPAGTFGVALAGVNWAGSANCGSCISIKGPGGNSIKAMIVDQCPSCPVDLDLFEDAFAKLAPKSKGIIDVSWTPVPCGITSPLILQNKSGTSKYWFSMQVMNANEPVAKLEVSTDGGKSWKATARKEYNFFENSSGFGTDAVDVRVTSSKGGVVVVKNVSIKENSKTTAGGNFA
ncbi:RlpA-like double-psi beta-barrel-protein domain-containing protein-containing protein [Massariosphaeria phaeospora]|uniref:RlpA-like double-psi beta-barrel-protein domain-containing protein-containing protein n=1 Tax=Massariosphaeria phaeospora TaxID=100035 RepID=A0A7C8I1J4_9PLEO|nr:RlpA-like double-psi beta-barrel-protein domain-containing protein-containing protein [Massariosphaeria phaeospora]